VRFKIDVSDRETGEVATVEVEAPTAGAARRHVQRAGYMVWATAPAPDVCGEPASPPVIIPALADPLLEAARHAAFRTHPVRFVVSPMCKGAAAVCSWLAAAVYLLHVDPVSLPLGVETSAGNLIRAAALCWLAGKWTGWPIARGRTAARAWADKQLVCRYCRRRGEVHLVERGPRRRLWANCSNCGIRWQF
jgi:hypothetical protein